MSILGEGLTASLERGSSSRVTTIQPANEENSTQYNAIHRMEFPLFNGEEARTWIRRAELWFQGHLEKSGMPSWSELTIIILRRFEDLDYERVVSEFNMLRQETTAILLARRQENMVNALLRKTNQQQKNNQSKAPFKPQNKSLPYKPSFKPSFKPRDEASQPRRFLTEAEVQNQTGSYAVSEEEAKAYEEAEDQIEEPPDSEDAIVSFHTMGGNVSSNTLRINGQVNGKDMHVLIDSGSTHCFIDEKVVQVLGCRLEPTTPMTVRIADGGRVISKFFCPTFCWEVQGHHFSHPVTITQSGKKIVLKALTERGDLKTLSAYSLSKLLRRGNYGIKGQIYVIDRDRMPDERDPRLLGLMHQFKDVFQEPKTLPPERIIEHHIELVPDAIPRKQHPYRYVHGQKTEIEKIVKDMLESGIIRTSQSSLLPLCCWSREGWKAITESLLRDGAISKPLTSLLKKDGFIWNPEAEAAFNHLKEVMASALVLALPNFSQTFVVETDAYGKGIGAVLMQEVKYKKGSENRAADALSRINHDKEKPQANAITTQVPLWMQDIQGSYEGNTLFQIVVQAKVLDNQAFPDYSYETGVLRRKGRICVGSHGAVRERIIKSMHDSALGGHSGINGTYQRIKPLFYWPTLKGDVNVGLTKYSHFIPLKHPYTASSIAKTFFDNIYKLHGLPVSIVTDRDRVSTSRFWKELFNMAGVSLDMSSAYHPQTDGQT
ncbi:UNVERIFIED_CONTAM: Transposon Ty3-G Gag-Pol polyprotein [Sesamum latifolium]|uniref:Transposon Ty3-G Gag-Pol polyprotein n=1 Tax=Sesamum latifolium TaxID=2727402 RepID=A0AAW2UV35_9LAMI